MRLIVREERAIRGLYHGETYFASAIELTSPGGAAWTFYSLRTLGAAVLDRPPQDPVKTFSDPTDVKRPLRKRPARAASGRGDIGVREVVAYSHQEGLIVAGSNHRSGFR